jgi:hypothetical protein
MKTYIEYAEKMLANPSDVMIKGIILDFWDEIRDAVADHRTDATLIVAWKQQNAKWKLFCAAVNNKNPAIGMNPDGFLEITKARFPEISAALGIKK